MSLLSLGGIGLALVAGGAVGGVFISRAMQHSAFDKLELQREDEQVGKPVARFAEEFLTPYDHSGDGAIQLVNPTGLPDRDERLTFESKAFTTKSFHFDPGAHDIFGGNPFGDTTTQHGTEQRAVSATNVWTAADVDHDQVVTSSELQEFAATFHANHDGYLNAAERTSMTAQHPLLQGQWTVTAPAR